MISPDDLPEMPASAPHAPVGTPPQPPAQYLDEVILRRFPEREAALYSHGPFAVAAALLIEYADARDEDADLHLVDIQTDTWTVHHPLACRADLFGCLYTHLGADVEQLAAQAGPSRWQVLITEEGVTFVPVDAEIVQVRQRPDGTYPPRPDVPRVFWRGETVPTETRLGDLWWRTDPERTPQT